jgi:pimeloyl-ACP methyl ester carboxylesterase
MRTAFLSRWQNVTPFSVFDYVHGFRSNGEFVMIERASYSRPWRIVLMLLMLVAALGEVAAHSGEPAAEILSPADWKAIREAHSVAKSGSPARLAFLKASNPDAEDRFGEAVAISGNTVVVGARGEDSAANGVNGNQADNSISFSGAVYVFVRSGAGWTQQAYIKASNPDSSDAFGSSVAIDGDTIVVGAFLEDGAAGGVNGDQSDNGRANAGAAYLFVRSGATWSQQAYLKASTPGFFDEFGFSVAIHGDIVAVGAPRNDSSATGIGGDDSNDDAFEAGAVYTFVRSGNTWAPQTFIKASNAAQQQFFGGAVALTEGTLVVGAPGADNGSGAAYVFVRSGTSWHQDAILKKASPASPGLSFGSAVAVAGEVAVVGAPRAAYVFERTSGEWSQRALLQNEGGPEIEQFGRSVAATQEMIVVAGPGAYVFGREGSSWSQRAYVAITAGEVVAASGGTFILGAQSNPSSAAGIDGDENDTSLFRAGAAYAFGVVAPPSPVIFIPGISGSTLVNHPSGVAEEIWVGFPKASRRALSLYEVDNPSPPDPNAKAIDATDATRYVQVLGQMASIIYGPLLETLTLTSGGGYREYEVSRFPFRRTTAGCDTTQFNADPSLNPNLFVFGYDWRKDNVETAAKLKDYVGCVRLFHPDSKITLLTHSMGGLVARRYVLDNPDHHIDKMITIVAPWLGAVKVLNVLETGNFIPHVADGPDMKYIAPSLPAAAQLLASRAYFELGGAPMLVEDGYDADGDDAYFETYQYDDVVEFIDNKYVQPAQTFPGTTNKAFHAHVTPAGAQDDWRGDATGVAYFHLYGVQAGNLTIAQLVARHRIVCSPFQILLCRFTDVFDLRFTVGDATVPARSAGRSTSFGNYNAAPANHIFRFAVSDADENSHADHVDICQNPNVLSKVLELLKQDVASSAVALSGAGSPDSAKQGIGLQVTDDELQSTIPSYYVTLDGATPLIVGDTQGNSTATITNDLRASVPGVQTYGLGDGVEMVTLPVPVSEEYSLTFLSDSRPIQLDVIMGVDNVTPTVAIRYLDTSLPAGVLAQIQITPTGVGELLYDSDGDGSFDTLVPPTVTLSGPAALDATPPTVTAHQSVQGGTTHVTLSASDSGSGVSSLRYSLDGIEYQHNTGTLSLNPITTPFVYAFADDNAGNRSSLVTVGVLKEAPIVIFQDGFE